MTSRSRNRSLIVQALTLVRMPLAIAFAALLAWRPPTWPVVAAALVILALGELSDLLDGMLARRWSVASEAGATLDPYSDSIARMIAYWGLANAGLAWTILPLVFAIRDVTVAYCRIISAGRGVSVSAKWSGKVKAVVQAVGAVVLLLLPLVVSPEQSWPRAFVSGIVLGATALSAIEYVVAAWRLIAASQKKGTERIIQDERKQGSETANSSRK